MAPTAPPPAAGPALPPALAEIRNGSVDEVVRSMKQHPFFMTSQDEIDSGSNRGPHRDGSGGQESNAGEQEDNVALEALKALAYEGTRYEIAENFRQQGNECHAARKWADAVRFYTKGLDALRARAGEGQRHDEENATEEERKETDGGKMAETEREKVDTLVDALLLNRAAGNLQLQNYRRVINDTSVVLSHTPTSTKASYRRAQAYLALSQPSSALSTLAEVIKHHSMPQAPPALLSLRDRAQKQLQDQEVQAAATAKRLAEEQAAARALQAALTRHGIRTSSSTSSPSDTTPITDLPDDTKMHLASPLDPSSTLYIPTLLIYPLTGQTDLIKALDVDSAVSSHLEYILPPPWTSSLGPADGEYTPGTVSCYLETFSPPPPRASHNTVQREKGLIKIGQKVPILQALQGTQKKKTTTTATNMRGGGVEEGEREKRVEVQDGILRIIVVPASRAEEWLGNFKRRRGVA